jgi:hypothetical protein
MQVLNTTSREYMRGLERARLGKTESQLEPTDLFQRDREEIAADVKSALTRIMAGEAAKTVQFADSAGRVQHLALMLSPYVEDDARTQVLDAYKTLFTRMEPDTKFTVVVATDQDRADVQQLIQDAGVQNPERIQLLSPQDANLTVWARDMMIPKFIPGDDSHSALMAQQPLHNWHLSDSTVPQIITDANPSIQLDNEPALVTDGGDVQANTKEAFAGYYSLAATENQLHEGLIGQPFKEDVIKWYQDKTGKTVIETPPNTTFPFRFVPMTAPDGTQITRMEDNPDYAMPALKDGQVSDAQMYDDLAVNLFELNLGKPVTIMGRDDVTTPHHEEPATDHMDMGLTPVDDKTFFVGDPTLTRRLLGNKTPAAWFNRDNPDDFNGYAKTLAGKGYNVLRLPHHEPAQNGDPYITYDNCLMERFQKDGQEVRRVFLPVYNIPELDNYATKVWQSQGFEVIPMPLDKLSAEWGALRCISNWLMRSPAA